MNFGIIGTKRAVRNRGVSVNRGTTVLHFELVVCFVKIS